MAISFPTPRSDVAQAVASIWGLQLGAQTMTDVLQIAAANGGVAAVVSSAFNSSFGAVSNEDVADMFVANLGITGTLAPGASDYVAGQLAGAADRSAVLTTITKAFMALSDTGDAAVDAMVASFNAKVAGAIIYSGTAGTADITLDGVPSASSFDLTVGLDALTGTSGADTFSAFIFDNQNTLQSGDRIDGGAGFDTLEASLGLSSAFAILPRTTNVEAVYIRSQANNSDGNNGDNNPAVGPVADGLANDNTIDAELMRGVKEWWSTDSRADLVIEDVRILDNEITKDITIGWANADPSSMEGEDFFNGLGDKVDYEVYFSPESLRKEGDTTNNAIRLTVGNQVEEADFDSNAPLADLPYTAVQFIVNDVTVVLNLAGLLDIETYDDMFAVFSASFNAAKASGEFASVLANVSINRIEDANTFFSRDGVQRVADVIELTVEDGTISPHPTLGWLAADGLPSNNAFSARVLQGAEVTISDLITSTVVLDNVGRESEAGDLVIGSMSTRTGVERFDVTVLNNDNTSGTYTSSGSWLGSMSSTNNFLREVLVKNDSTGIAEPDYLYVGTGMDEANNNLTTIRQTFLSTQSTQAGLAKYQALVDAALLNPDGLQDVRVFDASPMKGQVKVGAIITEAAIQKYQDLVDTDANDGFEDVEFKYATGSANDSVNLVLDEGLWDGNNSNSGVIPGRHDFQFTVNGNDGNDHLQVTIAGGEDDFNGGEGHGGDVAWYQNQKINQAEHQQIVINGGNGNDTIRTPGAGDMRINGESGNDTIYTDNTGGEDSGDFNEDRSAWVFNATNNDVFDLQSEQPAAVSVVNAHLKVHFRGYESAVVVIGNSAGANANVRITDLTVNQAIKDAINNNAVLSKLLVAEDGPGRTLIVRSLIDGDFNDDLSITFSNTALSASQLAVTPALTQFNPASTASSMTSLLDGYAHTSSAVHLQTGWDSITTSDNVIEGGTGNDVIVLSTTGYLNPSLDNDIWGSNETILYSGFGNGADTIVNFDTTYTQPGTPVTTLQNVAAVAEAVTLTFSASDGTPAAQTIIFDGVTVTLSAPATQGVIPAIDVAYQFAQQFAGGGTDWDFVNHDVGTNTVTIVRNTAGAFTDLATTDFTGTYKDVAATGGGGAVGVVTTTQGVDGATVGTQSTFTVTFDVAGTAADAAGSFVFDGTTVAYLEGDGAISLANKLEDATFANWTVARSADNQVTFTAKLEGDTAVGVDADFDVGTNVIVGVVAGVVGTANIGTPLVVTTVSPGGPGMGFDYLDFSSYDPAGVVVNGVTLIDVVGDAFTMGSAAPTGKTYSYVRMTESATNEGFYTIDLITVDALTTTSDVVQLIGTADFGDSAEVNFVADNFIV